MEAVKKLKLEHLVWIQAKVTLLFWALLYIYDPPPGAHAELGKPLVIISASFVVVGTAVSIVGIIMSTTDNFFKRQRALAIEVCGLIFATCGPLVFFIVQVVRVDDGDQYLTRAVYSYVLAAFMMARTVAILRILEKGRHYGS